ncbi:MAG: DUF3107 domain-containing protein [Actinomycetaceae bacterium]|nr:DUF3107 domain-containing protein [Actinomycetaceae bacterium]
MDITIGIRDVANAINVSVELDAAEVTAKVTNALETGNPLVLESDSGETVIVPADALGYVRADGTPQRRVGFGFS